MYSFGMNSEDTSRRLNAHPKSSPPRKTGGGKGIQKEQARNIPTSARLEHRWDPESDAESGHRTVHERLALGFIPWLKYSSTMHSMGAGGISARGLGAV